MGPGPPTVWILKFLFANYRWESVLSKFPKFHANTYTGSWRISDESVFLYKKKLHLGPRTPLSVILNIFSPVTIAEVYSTTSQSFMLLPIREVGELVMSQFLIIEKKLHFGPRPPLDDNLNIFLLVSIAEVYLSTTQCFILLPTREIWKFVIFSFYIAHIRKKIHLGPWPRSESQWVIIVILMPSREGTRQLPTFSCFYLHGKMEN